MRASLARALRVVPGLTGSADHRNAVTRADSRRVAAGRNVVAAAVASMEPLEGRRLLSTYYVSNYGSDSASGTSTGSAWKTINRVNAQKLKAGDKVLFKGGQSFSGGLYVPSAEGGTSTAPVTFSTYGSGRATIKSGGKSGIDVAQTAGVHLSNLNFVGSGMYNNSSTGIWMHVDWSNRKLYNISVKNVDAWGYGREGMRILIAGSGSSISNVRIERSNFHDNLYGGLKITGNSGSLNANKNYTIDHVKAWNNHGSKSSGSVTGNGIYLADVDGAMINRCVAYNNGKDGAAPVGIWAAGSNRVTIQYSESYNNKTRTSTDGGGFDFDWNVTNSVMQYNYSHGNHGPGFILAAGTKTNKNNVIRYNVSENDGRKNGRAGIQLWGNVRDAKIYNNVVYMSATGNSNSAAFYAHDNGSSGMRPYNVQIRNNIFVTTGGVKMLNVTAGVAGVSGGLKFVGNAYFSNGASYFKIQWGYNSYSTVAKWRNDKGQEKLNGVAVGYHGDPRLTKPGYGGTFGNADNLYKLSAYKLQSTSPLINRGVAHPTYLSTASKDFYGDSLPKGGKYDIGIDEVR